MKAAGSWRTDLGSIARLALLESEVDTERADVLGTIAVAVLTQARREGFLRARITAEPTSHAPQLRAQDPASRGSWLAPAHPGVAGRGVA